MDVELGVPEGISLYGVMGVSMKPTLDDLIRSAKFCGRTLFNDGEEYAPTHGICIWDEKTKQIDDWNPPCDAGQRDELLHTFLEAGWSVIYLSAEQGRLEYEDGSLIQFVCSSNDFLTLAASRVQEQSDG